MPGFDATAPSSSPPGPAAGASGAAAYDPEAVRAKYLAERDKRLVPGRADIRDLGTDEHFARYRDDPFTPFIERESVADDVDVVIVGGGIAGVLAGARLRQAGIERIRIVDQAGGIGGTWYWNRYPGVMCDVESYSYLPMLEELDTSLLGATPSVRRSGAISRRSPTGSTSWPMSSSTPGSPAPSGTRMRPGG